jgi:hypothetical protein
MPPKGVEWEVSYGPVGDTKPVTLLVDKDYDNVYLRKLLPGEGKEHQHKDLGKGGHGSTV